MFIVWRGFKSLEEGRAQGKANKIMHFTAYDKTRASRNQGNPVTQETNFFCEMVSFRF